MRGCARRGQRVSEHHEAAVKRLRDAIVRAPKGNLATGADKLAAQHKLFVRDRIALLVDDGTFVEDGLLANATAPGDDLPADGVVTGRALIEGRPYAHGHTRREGRIVGGSDGGKIIRLTRPRSATRLPSVGCRLGGADPDQSRFSPSAAAPANLLQPGSSVVARHRCCRSASRRGAYIPAFCEWCSGRRERLCTSARRAWPRR